MRIGEALALKWEDGDFRGRSIEVKRSIVSGSISTPRVVNPGALICVFSSQKL